MFQFSDDNATYILEPITNEVVYNDDPNIMWIQVGISDLLLTLKHSRSQKNSHVTAILQKFKLLFTRVFLQETVEVEQEAGEMGGQNMIIILNPNGTVNEELMQAHGINQVRKQDRKYRNVESSDMDL